MTYKSMIPGKPFNYKWIAINSVLLFAGLFTIFLGITAWNLVHLNYDETWIEIPLKYVCWVVMIIPGGVPCLIVTCWVCYELFDTRQGEEFRIR